jgi:hypothetical protein
MAAFINAGAIVAELVGVGFGGKDLDSAVNNKTQEENAAEFDAYIRSLPYLYPVDFSFHVYGDGTCPTLQNGIKIECIDDPNVEVSHGNYKTGRLYHNGEGGLVDYDGLLALEKADSEQYCQQGERQAYYNVEFNYNIDLNEDVFGDDLGVIAACCPVGTDFTGTECLPSGSYVKVQRTKDQLGRYRCRKAFGLDSGLKGYDEYGDFICAKGGTLGMSSESTTTYSTSNPVADYIYNNNSNNNNMDTIEEEKEDESEEPPPQTTNLSEAELKRLEDFRNIARS